MIFIIDPPFVRNPYNYDTNQASNESGLECKDPTLAQQQFAEESDINFIADRFGLTGELPTVLQLPRYADFGDQIFDFQTAQNAVVAAKQQFMTLPAKLRSRFDNDPQKLLTFLEDPDNKDEAIFLGLVEKPKIEPQSLQGDPGAAGAPVPPAGDSKPPEPPKPTP